MIEAWPFNLTFMNRPSLYRRTPLIVALWLSLGICTPTRAINGLDFITHFFEQREFRVIGTEFEQGVPTPVLISPYMRMSYTPQTGDHPIWKTAPESYLIMDTFGNRHSLILSNQRLIANRLMLHQLLELLEVVHLPSHPIFVKRGLFGIPTIAEAKSYFPNAAKVGREATPDGEWFPAVVQPLMAEQPLSANLSAVALADQFIQGLIQHLLLAEKVMRTQIDGVQVMLGLTGLYSKILQVKGGRGPYSLQSTFWPPGVDKASESVVSLPQISKLSANDAKIFVARIGRFLDRLDALRNSRVYLELHTPLMRIDFEATQRASPELNLKRETSVRKLVQELAVVAGTLRQETTAFLTSKVRGPFARKQSTGGVQLPDGSLFVRGEIPTPLAVLPVDTAASPQTVLLNAKGEFMGAKNTLLSLSMRNYSQRAEVLSWINNRNENFSEFPQGLDPMDTLLPMAAYTDSQRHIIVSNMNRSAIVRASKFDETQQQPQLFLNDQLDSGILFVYSPNDRECNLAGDLIARLSKKLPIHAFEVDVPQGRSLNDEHMSQARLRALQLGVHSVAVLELGRLRQTWFESFSEAGLALCHYDHHGEPGSNRMNQLSVLEQLWMTLGYEPSLSEVIVAILDRSGVYGLRDLNMSFEEVRTFFQDGRGGGERFISHYESIKSQLNLPEPEARALYELDPFSGNRAQGMFPFQLHHYPHRTNVFVVGENRLWFSGEPSAVMALAEEFAQHPKLEPEQYFGGETRLQNWGLKFGRVSGSNEQNRATSAYFARQALAKVFKPQDSCRVHIANWATLIR